MKLEEKHKEFVIQGYARFMKRSEIVEAFIEEFKEEIYQLCTPTISAPQKSSWDKDIKDVNQYIQMHGFPASRDEAEEYAHALAQNMSDRVALEKAITVAQKAAKEKLSARFRRLNITHPQFPEKYRALFNETREQYLANYRSASLSIPENVILELETLYELTKELAFEQRDLKHIAQATQILKTIAACNAVNAQRAPIDLTPQDVKALKDTQNTLAAQVKKETRQLAKHTEDKNA